MRILIIFGLITLTQCGVRKNPVAQRSEKGPHSALIAPQNNEEAESE